MLGQSSLGGFLSARGPLHRCVVFYLDDLLCYSPNLKQHIQDVREVLTILCQEKLYVEALKYKIGRREIGFLDHRVSGEGVAVDPQKFSAVRIGRDLLRTSLQLLPPFRGRIRGRRGAADSPLRPTRSLGLGPTEAQNFERLKM